MIKYKIDGVAATFQSKPANLQRDINRILAQEGLAPETNVTILENDIHQPATDSASLGNTGELETLPEDLATSDGVDEPKLSTEATDLSAVSDRVDKFDLSDDESITDFNDYPFESK